MSVCEEINFFTEEYWEKDNEEISLQRRCREKRKELGRGLIKAMGPVCYHFYRYSGCQRCREKYLKGIKSLIKLPPLTSYEKKMQEDMSDKSYKVLHFFHRSDAYAEYVANRWFKCWIMKKRMFNDQWMNNVNKMFNEINNTII